MNREDELVYGVEQLALEGTPLMDRMDRRSLITECHEVARAVPTLVGSISIEEGVVGMTRAAAYANRHKVVFAPRAVWRFTIAHELSHVVHIRMGGAGGDHGHVWRGVYAEMISIIYGDQYGQLLLSAFDQANLIVKPANLPRFGSPLIDIDRMAAATQTSRWL